MVSVSDAIKWINKYELTTASTRLYTYKKRNSFLTPCTQELIYQMHIAGKNNKAHLVWNINRHLLNLCDSEAFSVHERAETFLECGYVIFQMGQLARAAELFEKAANNFGNSHNMGLAYWGRGCALWQLQHRREDATVAWRVAISSLRDCIDNNKNKISKLQSPSASAPTDPTTELEYREQIAWYRGVITDMNADLIQQIQKNGF